MCRCYHCKSPYVYHPSGDSNDYSNDRYCPECYKLILDTLHKIPCKKQAIFLPTEELDEVTIEIFEKKYEEQKLNIIFSNMRSFIYNYPINFDYLECEINDINYRLVINKDTEEKLLMKEYQEDIKTKELDGPWYNYKKRFM